MLIVHKSKLLSAADVSKMRRRNHSRGSVMSMESDNFPMRHQSSQLDNTR